MRMMALLLQLCLLLMTTCVVLCDDAHINGTWSSVMDWPLAPIHMVLTTTGKILTYGWNKNSDQLYQRGQRFYYDLWDPSSGVHDTIETDADGNTDTTIFCSGQVTVPSTGEIMITGGSETINGKQNYGVAHVQFFDPVTETIQLAPRNMHFPRWYPSVTVLANEHVLLQGGRGATDPKRGITTPEIYNPVTGTWRTLDGANNTFYNTRNGWWYPKSYSARQNTALVFPNGQNQIWKLDPRGAGSLEAVGTVPGQPFNYRAPATMFNRNKLLLIQGVQDASVIDFDDPDQPTVQATGSLREPRYWANSVSLPTGEVLVVGGASVDQILDKAVNYVEIWNPNTGQWRVGASAAKARLYHSTAMLLPDATVLVAGGGPPGPIINRNAEIYEPPYLFDANGQHATRPVITSLSSEPGYGQTIQVNFADATKISRIALIRFGSVTHSFNMDERMLFLAFTQHSNALALDVQFTFGKAVVPPGFYMMFLVNEHGVPSTARVVQLL